MLFYAECFGAAFKLQAVVFAFAGEQVWVGSTEYDINNFWVCFAYPWQRVDHVFDSLCGAEQAEGKEHRSPEHAKLVFVKIRVDERYVWYPVRDQFDLLVWYMVHFA